MKDHQRNDEHAHERPASERARELREILTEQEIREKEQRDRWLSRESPRQDGVRE